jgi:hypothetical protein
MWQGRQQAALDVVRAVEEADMDDIDVDFGQALLVHLDDGTDELEEEKIDASDQVRRHTTQPVSNDTQ